MCASQTLLSSTADVCCSAPGRDTTGMHREKRMFALFHVNCDLQGWRRWSEHYWPSPQPRRRGRILQEMLLLVQDVRWTQRLSGRNVFTVSLLYILLIVNCHFQCLTCYGDADLDTESSEDEMGGYCYNKSLVARVFSSSRW